MMKLPPAPPPTTPIFEEPPQPALLVTTEQGEVFEAKVVGSTEDVVRSIVLLENTGPTLEQLEMALEREPESVTNTYPTSTGPPNPEFAESSYPALAETSTQSPHSDVEQQGRVLVQVLNHAPSYSEAEKRTDSDPEQHQPAGIGNFEEVESSIPTNHSEVMKPLITSGQREPDAVSIPGDKTEPIIESRATQSPPKEAIVLDYIENRMETSSTDGVDEAKAIVVQASLASSEEPLGSTPAYDQRFRRISSSVKTWKLAPEDEHVHPDTLPSRTPSPDFIVDRKAKLRRKIPNVVYIALLGHEVAAVAKDLIIKRAEPHVRIP